MFTLVETYVLVLLTYVAHFSTEEERFVVGGDGRVGPGRCPHKSVKEGRFVPTDEAMRHSSFSLYALLLMITKHLVAKAD